MGQPMMLKTSYTGNGGRTRRTETSQYPQEKKEISISRVVASEKERAQTMELALWGCGIPTKESERQPNMLGNMTAEGERPVGESGNS